MICIKSNKLQDNECFCYTVIDATRCLLTGYEYAYTTQDPDGVPCAVFRKKMAAETVDE